MNKPLMLCPLAAVLALMTGCVSPVRRNAGISEAILKDDRPDLVKVAAAAAGFRKRDFSEEQLGKYSDGELDRLYESLYRTTFYFPGQRGYIALQEEVLAEKAKRKRQTDEDAEHLHWAYVGARMFDRAAALRQKFPGGNYPAIPAQITGADIGKTYWQAYEVSDGGKKAELGVLPLGSGPKVVMEMFTGCPTAEKALEEIMASPKLSAVFRKYGVLLTDRFDAVGVVLWKEHFKFTEVYIAHQRGDFPGVNFRTSPNFYFFSNGKILFSVSGWSNKAEPEAGPINLIKGFEAIAVQAGS